jgi:hypothetical protein
MLVRTHQNNTNATYIDITTNKYYEVQQPTNHIEPLKFPVKVLSTDELYDSFEYVLED